MNDASPRIVSWESHRFPADLDWQRFSYGILESAPDTRMVVGPTAESVESERYDAGVLFGEETEMRWRKRRNGRTHFVVIEDGAPSAVPESELSRDSRLAVIEAAENGLPERVLLWGVRRGDRWYESRIPKAIAGYPAVAGDRVAIEMRHYALKIHAPLPGGETEERIAVISRYVRLSGVTVQKEG